ncbi:MAG TPA: hypothetical protein EYQ74_06415 [Planctomycetes bacterium]|nr:hypothetical protein [Planctomycetota bacterium]HIK60395.1 hypothetical protein [Planctomycetota bacterium]
MHARPPRRDSRQSPKHSPRRHLQGLIGWGTLCLILAGHGAGTEATATADGVALELSDGPAAKAWAGVGSETVPHPLHPNLRKACASSSPAGTSVPTWHMWADWVADEALETAPARRAALCLLARAQGRNADAWGHYAKLGADPRWVASVTPYLLPGAPLDSPVEAGGNLAPLPDGVLLQPFLPPPIEDGGAAPAGGAWRKATVRGIRVGKATLDLTISVEATGVQVDVAHRGGGPAKVAILIPEPPGYEIRIEYLDWMQTDEPRLPILVDLQPGGEPSTLWGRMIQRSVSLPTGQAQRLPQSLVQGGLFLSLPADDPQRDAVGQITPVLEKLLGVHVGLTQPGTPLPGWTGTVLHLGSAADRGKRLTWLASAIEAFLLQS